MRYIHLTLRDIPCRTAVVPRWRNNFLEDSTLARRRVAAHYTRLPIGHSTRHHREQAFPCAVAKQSEFRLGIASVLHHEAMDISVRNAGSV